MGTDQLRKSSLRRSLQACFLSGVLNILNNSPRRNKIETRFSAAWRWMLAISAFRRQKSEDLLDPILARRFVEDSGIIASEGAKPIGHQRLFQRPGMKSIPDAALSLGLEAISPQSILSNMEKKHRNGLENPWNHILPEDIGSCYELIREVEPVLKGGTISLNQVKGRRNSGIHHTPHDVTDFMGREAIRLFEGEKPTDIDELVICDLAVGAGAFILQTSRIVSERSGLEIADFLRENAIGFDIDQQVLWVAGLCFHLQAGCPQKVTEYNLHCLDSLGKRATGRIVEKISRLSKSDGRRADITIGNPPYVRAITHEWQGSGFKSEKSRNLSSYFIEQACRVTKRSGVISQIVPLSLAQGNTAESTRRMLESTCSNIEIRAFDCVPGYMFDQGKIGSNSNSAITQRVAIFNCKIGNTDAPKIITSRLTRWGSQERDILFDNIPTTVLLPTLTIERGYPLLGDKWTKNILMQALSTNRKIGDTVVDSGRYRLFVPSAIRYFTTASREDLNRNQLEITFDSIEDRNLAQVIIVSSYFYWYWRIYGNGFQISLENLVSAPMPTAEAASSRRPDITRMADRMHGLRKKLSVSKSNKGEIANIKYDLDTKLMNDLDGLVNNLFSFPTDANLHSAKSNSLASFNADNQR